VSRVGAGERRAADISPAGVRAAEPGVGVRAGVGRRVTEQFLDPEQLVVLRDALAAGPGAPVLIWPQLVATARSEIVVVVGLAGAVG